MDVNVSMFDKLILLIIIYLVGCKTIDFVLSNYILL